MNVHDSEKMAGLLNREGLIAADDPNEADLIIYNTCSIREKAEHKFFSDLGRMKSLKRKRPGIRIAVAGCIAQQQGEGVFRRAPHVDFVLGPQNIHLLSGLIKGPSGAVANNDNPDLADLEYPALRKEGSRAWVTIMYGCDNFCSYCIVPYTRGREQSRPSYAILKEINDLAGHGFREVTLLGQNVNSYRSEIAFPGLLEIINDIKGIERIRFVTSHPRDLSVDLISAMGRLDKVCEHIHLPLQSGSDRILSLMNRGYTLDEYKKKVERLRKVISEISITTDIITGFPGETEEEHRMTVRAIREIGYDGIFAFKYSMREGTVAAGMENQIEDSVSSARLTEILELQDHITLNINKSLEGSFQEVLIEGLSENDPGFLTGRTRTNKIVNFRGDLSLRNHTAKVKVLEAKKHSLYGTLV